MCEYLKRFLNEQINVVFIGGDILKATLLEVDSIGVVVSDLKNGRIVMIPFSSGVAFTVVKKDI